MNAIECVNVSKSFQDFQLEPLNLVLPSGCILGLIGENGAGKSTVIKLILDLLHKDGGSIMLFGKNQEEHLTLLKEDIGVVPDEIGIPECLSAKQVGNIMHHTFRHWDSAEYSRLLSRFSIPEQKPFKDFSRGMKMKLGIAVAMSHHAKLLLLDEATNGLDPVVRDEVVEMLYDFTRDENHSILISSHIVSDLEKLCDYIAFLHRGKLLLFEEKDRLLEEYGFIHCSLEEMNRFDDSVVLYKKMSLYGAEAIVRRRDIPDGMSVSPVSLEDLFVFMVKEVK